MDVDVNGSWRLWNGMMEHHQIPNDSWSSSSDPESNIRWTDSQYRIRIDDRGTLLSSSTGIRIIVISINTLANATSVHSSLFNDQKSMDAIIIIIFFFFPSVNRSWWESIGGNQIRLSWHRLVVKDSWESIRNYTCHDDLAALYPLTVRLLSLNHFSSSSNSCVMNRMLRIEDPSPHTLHNPWLSSSRDTLWVTFPDFIWKSRFISYIISIVSSSLDWMPQTWKGILSSIWYSPLVISSSLISFPDPENPTLLDLLIHEETEFLPREKRIDFFGETSS